MDGSHRNKIPGWASAVRHNAMSHVRGRLLEDARTSLGDLEPHRRDRILADVERELEIAWGVLTPAEKREHDWVALVADSRFAELAPQLPDKRWQYLSVRLADRIIQECTAIALEAGRYHLPGMEHDQQMVKLAVTLKGIGERFLGTDAMVGRPKVRHSVRMLFRQLGQVAGPWVGHSITAKRPASETLAFLALAFAVDVWRFWSDAAEDPTPGYEHQQFETWRLFFLQLVHCRMALEAALDAEEFENSNPVGSAELRTEMCDEFGGGELSEVLATTWGALYNRKRPTSLGGSLNSWGEPLMVDWSSIFFRVRTMRMAHPHALFVEELQSMFRIGVMQVEIPKWSPTRTEHLHWMLLGGDLHQKEFGHLFR